MEDLQQLRVTRRSLFAVQNAPGRTAGQSGCHAELQLGHQPGRVPLREHPRSAFAEHPPVTACRKLSVRPDRVHAPVVVPQIVTTTVRVVSTNPTGDDDVSHLS